jgi:hypothetical protein
MQNSDLVREGVGGKRGLREIELGVHRGGKESCEMKAGAGAWQLGKWLALRAGENVLNFENKSGSNRCTFQFASCSAYFRASSHTTSDVLSCSATLTTQSSPNPDDAAASAAVAATSESSSATNAAACHGTLACSVTVR